MKNMHKLISIEALINGVYNYLLWEYMYALPNTTQLSVKLAMINNNNMVKEANIIRQSYPRFYKVESLTKTSKTNTKKHIHDHLTFPNLLTAHLTTIQTKVLVAITSNI